MKINHLAVWIVAFFLQIIGAVWYSNWGFGPVWMAGLGKPSDAQWVSDPLPYILSLISSIIFCYGAYLLIEMLPIRSVPKALSTGIFIGFFFLLPSILTHYSFIGVNYIVTLIDWGMSTVLVTISFITLSIVANYTNKKADKKDSDIKNEKEIEPLANNLG